VLVVLLAAAAVVLSASVLRGEDRAASSSPTLMGPATAPFGIDYPSTWQPVGDSQRVQLPGQPLAVLRRKDGRGTVVVTKRPPVTTPLDELPAGLEAKLSKRFPDFREVGAKVVNLGDARALVYTFARTRTGTAQSLVVVPSGDHSFTLNAVVPPHSPEAAREVGAIIASFRPTGDS
jgi:hypothetical protein